jgi:hypothetical protein
MAPQTRHPSRWIAIAALLTAGVPLPEALAQPPASCPKGRRVQVKPQELKKKVRKAASAAELETLLEPLGMTTEWRKEACTQKDKPSVVLDVFRARLFSAEKQDLVLQARGEVCAQGLVALLDGVVLHPLEGQDTFCAIDIPFLPGVLNNFHGKTVFGFEKLTDPVRQVFRVDSATVDARNTTEELSYWEVQEGELRSIFSMMTSGEHLGFVNSAASAKVTVQGSRFPRELHIQESTRSCGRFVDMPSGESVYSQDCTEASNELRLCYQRAPNGPHSAYTECS